MNDTVDWCQVDVSIVYFFLFCSDRTNIHVK